jgi:putative peptide zinc metalloprotease protein
MACGYLFSRAGMILAASIAVGGFVAFGAVAAQGRFEFTPQSVGLGFVVLFTLNLVLVFIHELGHAALLVHYGRRVKSSGFRIYFGMPAFFIDSSDVLMLSRGQRIAQSFAGPYFEMVATGIAAIALWAWPHSGVAAVLYRFVILNYFVLLLNLAPMLDRLAVHGVPFRLSSWSQCGRSRRVCLSRRRPSGCHPGDTEGGCLGCANTAGRGSK